ncbi:hypothetical protein ACHHV8_10075 [Paenibacillus sp. TAB 01]|uniref:hypothetical protein n=1 Tax=Paenibacillus sp. TAB 01 TaxID=3368988 RepID=UPI0037505F29
MDIVFAVNNFADSIILPVNPTSDFMADMNKRKNEQFERVDGTPLNLPGPRDLKTLTLTSFFPVKWYPFMKGERLGWDCVVWFNTYINQRIPLRLIVTVGDVEMMNIAVIVDDFSYGVDKPGDIPYTLTLSEFPFGDGTQ